MGGGGSHMMDGDDMHMDDSPAVGGGYGAYNASGQTAMRPTASGTRRGSDFMSGGMMGAGGNGTTGHPPRLGEAARMQELANSQDLPGGPNHRPLVGGFAAAAYEAAKAHHYSQKRDPNGDNASIPRDRPAPPSI